MLENIELSRQTVQRSLDADKTMLERNIWGQYATPPRLADEILEYAKSLLPSALMIRFLDPAFGTGAFYSSLLKVFSKERIEKPMGFEKDETVALESRRIWQGTQLDLQVNDFTLAEIPQTEQDKANLIICNPPYIRHHHLSRADKVRLKFLSDSITGRSFSGLTGFYGYFMAICHAWMAKGATAGWLIPSEFMDVNYGREIKKYLLNRITLLRIHRYDPEDAQFDDALVSSSVVWFTNTAPEPDHHIEFTFGGSLKEPHERKHISAEKAAATPKWSVLPFTRTETKNTVETCRLSDLFSVKRGLATGANEFFILSPRQIDEHNLPRQFLIPILPSSRYIRDNVVEADPNGNPILEQQLYLLNCSLPEDEIKSDFPFLWKYLQIGIELGINERYLCKSRTPWYSQENRPAAPIVCTYMGRSNKETGKPFRFILNHSMATAANGFLMMYPKPNLFNSNLSDSDFITSVWQQLNNLSVNEITDEGRVYGGGLYKIEPRELGNIKIKI